MNDMIDYLEHRVSEEELKSIFKKHIDRNIFISEYPYFGSDKNEAFYEEFIEESLFKHGFKVQEDAIELSIATNTFNISFLVEIKKILYSKRQESIKLTCLDWLSYFFQDIPEDDFIEINNYALKYSKSELLKIQSILNILLFKSGDQLIEKLIRCLEESDNPTVFYRLANGLDTIQVAVNFTEKVINTIKEILLSKQRISIKQKEEIFIKLSKVISN